MIFQYVKITNNQVGPVGAELVKLSLCVWWEESSVGVFNQYVRCTFCWFRYFPRHKHSYSGVILKLKMRLLCTFRYGMSVVLPILWPSTVPHKLNIRRQTGETKCSLLQMMKLVVIKKRCLPCHWDSNLIDNENVCFQLSARSLVIPH